MGGTPVPLPRTGPHGHPPDQTGAHRPVRRCLLSTRRARIVFAAVALWLVAAVPTLAVQGPTKLERASVSAVKGTTSTVFTFEVTYRSVTGISPDYVRVSVAGSTHAMTGSGTHWRDGVRFRWRGTLPNGTHVVVFRARDAERFVDELKYRSRIVVGSGGPGPDASVDPSDGASADPSDEPDSGDGVAPPPIDGRDSPWNEPGGPGGEADASLGGGTTAGPPPAATDDGVDRSPAAFLGWLGDRLADAGTTILATIGGGSAANGMSQTWPLTGSTRASPLPKKRLVHM